LPRGTGAVKELSALALATGNVGGKKIRPTFDREGKIDKNENHSHL
jgi:hypothetical protein